MVLVGQDRMQRYTDAVKNNPSITEDVRVDAETARDLAFQYVDQNNIVPTYRVLANGERDADGGNFGFAVAVVVEQPEG